LGAYSNLPGRSKQGFSGRLAFIFALAALVASAGCGLTDSATNNNGQLLASSASVSFGNINVGSSTSQLVTLTNRGTTVVNIGKIAASGPGFSASGGSNAALSPDQSVSVYVNFNPGAAGAVRGTVSISSDASNPLLRISVSGTGVGTKPQTHSVALSWSPSTSQVIGYFVYRSTSSGGPYSRLNSSVDALPTYKDSGLKTGNYYYVVTSVSSQNVESGYSNEVAIVIP
jgi:Abnormal spindle-like microcephaly-assoc'd, ASPM-SPD-2-Hydin